MTARFKDERYSFDVLDDVVGRVDEEAGRHAVPLLLLGVDLEKIAGTHGELER